jgi:SAM-dependent methyltransferase
MTDFVGVCHLCGQTDPIELFKTQDHVTAERFGIVTCRRCRLAWTNPRVALEMLKHYYPDTYYGPAGRRFGFGLEQVVTWFRQRIANRIQQAHPQPGQILEVGSGRGTLLAEMARRGWKAVGTEFSESLSGSAVSELGIQVYRTPDIQACDFPAAAFDVVILQHVLEHLPAPVTTLQELRRIIKPEGSLIVVVPNFGGLVAQWTRGSWFGLDVPRHMFHFTADSLKQALAASGFAIQHLQTLSLEQDVFGAAQSLLNAAGAPFNLFYDQIRNPQARMRYAGAKALPVGVQAGVFAFGLALSLVGLPIAVVTALIGRGGTLEVWAKPA